MKQPEVVIVRADDWMGVYLDGKLTYQGHSISEWHLLNMLGIKSTYVQADLEWMETRGDLPDCLSDVQMET